MTAPALRARVQDTLDRKAVLLAQVQDPSCLPEAAHWTGPQAVFADKAARVGVLSTQDEDVRSLRELITYGLKGLAAYTKHANALGQEDPDLDAFLQRALAATLDHRLTQEELVALALETGQYGVTGMALLDRANTTAYGHPEITKVSLGVGTRPRHSGLRPRPAGLGDAPGTDPGHRGGRLHPFRNAPGPRLSRFSQIPQLHRQLRQRLVAAKEEIRVLQRPHPDDHQLYRSPARRATGNACTPPGPPAGRGAGTSPGDIGQEKDFSPSSPRPKPARPPRPWSRENW